MLYCGVSSWSNCAVHFWLGLLAQLGDVHGLHRGPSGRLGRGYDVLWRSLCIFAIYSILYMSNGSQPAVSTYPDLMGASYGR